MISNHIGAVTLILAVIELLMILVVAKIEHAHPELAMEVMR